MASTMARRSPRMRLNRADFPTFGRPTMATRGRAIRWALALSTYGAVASTAQRKCEPIIGTVSDGRVVLKENRIMMVSDEMGDIPAANSKGLGLYFSDTRFVSTYEFRLNRLQPILLSASVDESYVATFQMVNPVLLLDEGKRRIPQQSLSIRRSRFIYGGLHERIGIQNCGTEPVAIECSLRIESDFRDMFDVRGYKVQTLGTIRPTEVNTRGMTFTYDGQDGLMRRTEVVVKPDPRTLNEDGTLNWDFHLNSKDTITLIIDVIPVIGENEPMLSYLRSEERRVGKEWRSR